MSIKVTGKTFAHRDQLQRMGGRWSGAAGAWLLPDNADRSVLGRMVGVINP